MRNMRWMKLGLLAGVLLGGPVVVSAAPGPGLWVVAVTPDDASARAGAQTFDDTLLFEEDGTLTAEAFGMYGFAPAPVTGSDEDSNAFSANGASTDCGSTVWTGRVGSSEVTGHLTWNRSDGTVCRYTFRGQRAVAE
ncbi:MAG: hypothetical protein ACREIT_07380 [Tepidisphaeraceae bacterium]